MNVFTKTTAMPHFGVAHLLPVLLLILIVVSFQFLKSSAVSSINQKRLGHVLAWILCVNFPFFVLLQVLDGSISWATALPLYPCPLASLLAPILMRTENKTLFNVMFYWVFSGTLQAVMTPEIKYTFPHYEYFYFWICHAGLLVFLSYTLVIQDAEPKAKGVVTAFAWFNVFIAISALVNMFTGSNYYYLKSKPAVPTLIDHLGPWPWYILGVEAVAFLQFGLSFAIFWFVKKRLLGAKNKSNIRVSAYVIRAEIISKTFKKPHQA